MRLTRGDASLKLIADKANLGSICDWHSLSASSLHALATSSTLLNVLTQPSSPFFLSLVATTVVTVLSLGSWTVTSILPSSYSTFPNNTLFCHGRPSKTLYGARGTT